MITELEKYASLWAALAAIDSVSIDRVYYDHSKRIEHQNETRQQALLAARAKAKALAETLGSQIGEPLIIEDNSRFRDDLVSPTYSSTRGVTDNDSGDGYGIALGRIPIRMRVKATFRLITQEK